MTSYTNTTRQARDFAETVSLGILAERCKAALVRWRRIQRNRVSLSDLDDWLLADLGIRRDQIDHVARAGKLPGWM